MDEKHFEEIDVVMLYVEEARRRAESAATALRRDGAEQHLIDALETSERELGEVARRLRQGTFFAVPKDQLSV